MASIPCPHCSAVHPLETFEPAGEGPCPSCGGTILARPAGRAGPVTGEGKGALPGSPGKAGTLPRIPGYELLEEIGRGGMGVVYRAHHPKLKRDVAIKMIGEKIAANPAFARRFETEAQAMAALHHPNIVTVHDMGICEGRPYLVMEYVEGRSLEDILIGATGSEPRGLPVERVVALGRQIAEALRDTHARGVIHRDLKPGNVLVSTGGTVKITDFGLAKIAADGDGGAGHTSTDVVLGTVHYMSPEQQTRSCDVDYRTDLFSLGVILFEMLTGRVPRGVFDPPSAGRPEVPGALDELVMALLATEPEKRPQSTDDVLDILEALAGGRPVRRRKRRPSRPVPPVAKGRREEQLVPAALKAGAVAAASFGDSSPGSGLALWLGGAAVAAMVLVAGLLVLGSDQSTDDTPPLARGETPTVGSPIDGSGTGMSDSGDTGGSPVQEPGEPSPTGTVVDRAPMVAGAGGGRGGGGDAFARMQRRKAARHVKEGDEAFRKYDYQSAARSYQLATDLVPEWAEPFNKLGNALNLQGRLEEALAAYQRALALKPGWAKVEYNIATAYFNRRRYEEALAHIERALETAKDPSDRRRYMDIRSDCLARLAR